MYGEDTDASTLDKTDSKQEPWILCKSCSYPITAESSRIEKQGAFRHTFTNPAGYIYRVGCFGSAPGGAIVGGYSADFSWFKHYAWCYMVCSSCYRHLGWHYSGTEGTDFYGLILDHLST